MATKRARRVRWTRAERVAASELIKAAELLQQAPTRQVKADEIGAALLARALNILRKRVAPCEESTEALRKAIEGWR